MHIDTTLFISYLDIFLFPEILLGEKGNEFLHSLNYKVYIRFILKKKYMISLDLEFTN